MWGKINHIAEILDIIPKVLGAQPGIWQMGRVLRGNRSVWLFPGALSAGTAGGQHLLFLLSVLTSELLWQQFSPLWEEMGGCHWCVRVDCSTASLWRACFVHASLIWQQPICSWGKHLLSTQYFLDVALAVFSREQHDTFTFFWNSCWMSPNFPATIFIS